MQQRTFALVLFLASHVSHWAPVYAEGWRVEQRVDSMTDRPITTAVIANKSGHSLSLYQTDDGSAVANFSLPDRTADALDSEKLILVRVDKYPPEDVGQMLRMEREFKIDGLVEWQPKWVNFSLGRNKDDPSRMVRRLQKGQRVVVRYYLFTGGYKETEFSLAGARTAISEAIGVSADLDANAEKRIEDAEAASREVAKVRSATAGRCFESTDSLLCTQQLGNCVRATPDPTPENAAVLIECLEKVGTSNAQ